MREKRTIMDGAHIERALRRVADEILEHNGGAAGLMLLGIQRRGVYLANRLADLLQNAEKVKVPKGQLDITLYRDDLTLLSDEPIVHSTSLPGDVTGQKIILADDVLYTGRTIRAALDALTDLGRPASVQLVVLVDRGHRELPIQPDFLGRRVPTALSETVEVRLSELDGEDRVVVCQAGELRRGTGDDEGLDRHAEGSGADRP